MRKILFFLISAAITLACASATCRATGVKITVVYGERATAVERNAAGELAKDISRVCGADVKTVSEKSAAATRNKGMIFIVGTAETNKSIKALASMGKMKISTADPGPEAFVIQPFPAKNTVVIAGADARGVLYGAYEYSNRFLGVDPNEYWTGKTPPKKKSPPMPASAIREKPPVFPLRGYFDNDDDMIANWKGKKLIIEFETWKEMIDSLARMRYNYIDLHDTLGRAEFWNWQYYKEKFPGYKTDLDLISKIIDYAHGKGMLVQVPMYLGWEFHHLPYDKICLGEYHEDWMAVYEYYLKETPLGKADLFLQRPRDPWWDKGYACQEEIAAGTDPGPLMTKMFNGLQVLVDEYRPGGKVICDLWAEGRDMWRRDAFNPSNEIDMLWADNGYAVYSEWPSDFKNHKFGIYVHAGYYLNHVMQDPYPERIKEVTTEAVKRGMTANYFVNGQDFKHFILNLEACGRAAWNPAAFNPEAFYKEWATRYFGAAASGEIINSLKMLHKANAEIGGFTKVMDMTDEIVTKLKLMQSEKTDTSTVARAMGFAEASLASAEQAAASVPSDARLLYDDQILFPARIYLQDLKLYQASAETMRAFDDKKNPATSPEGRKEAKARLEDWKRKLPVELKTMIDLLNQGSSWKKWEGWTKVENFRKITPPPDPAIVGRTVKSLH